MTPAYESFLDRKRITAAPVGFAFSPLHQSMRTDQRDITRWLGHRGRAAAFTDCGTGKSFIQQEWSIQVAAHAGTVLNLAPLSVAEQSVRESAHWGRTMHLCQSQSDVVAGAVNITNYEKLHKFSPIGLAGIVLDESSILKSFDGSTRKAITEFARNIPYRLACTATPSPNDYTELGNHAEFLGIMSMAEMLATFFVHDGGETAKWRLKGHAEKEFWRWLASWAIFMRKPSDLGYSDEGFELPQLIVNEHILESGPAEGFLFAMEARTLQERRAARRGSLADRVRACAERVNVTRDQFLVWCELNDESDALHEAIPDSVEVRGSDSEDHRKDAMLGFAEGRYRVLISKPRICGFGMNFQNSHRMAFVGVSDSYEQTYQAIRRQWRYGQLHAVEVDLYLGETETAVLANQKRKQADADKMSGAMIEHMKEFSQREIAGAATREHDTHESAERTGKRWRAYLGDCVNLVSRMPDDYFHYSIYSPPFGSLYTYSNSVMDMGNSRNWEEFWAHYDFLVKELYRVMKPGRQLSFHCMTMPTSKQNNGYIGAHDFRGDLIRAHEKHGFIFHSEVTIRKNPVTAMQRTKALGLLHKTVKTNRVMVRQGFADYLVTMRKPGEAEDRITGLLDCYIGDELDEDFTKWCRQRYNERPDVTDGRSLSFEEFKSIQIWQRYADPVWDDIDPSDTLQRESAREEKDEKHIAPLQLQVIRRGIQLWTEPGDSVLSPFGGIGSEGYVAVQMGREAVICELKRSYYDQAVLNLARAESEEKQQDLFAVTED